MTELIQRFPTKFEAAARLRAKQVARFVGLVCVFLLGFAVLFVAYVAGNVFTM